MTSAVRVRLAVVGAGLMGSRVAAAGAAHPDIDLAGVVDADWTKAQEVAAAHGAVAFETIAAAAAVADAVYIGSPSTLHAPHIIEALRLGLDVLVDKPMTLTAADADDVGAAVEASGRVLMVGFSYRYRAEWQAAAAWVADGRIGDIRLVSDLIVEAAEGNPPWYGSIADGGGVLQLQAHHCMDRIRWIIGQSVQVTGAEGLAAELGEAESHAVIQARSDGGAVIAVALGFATGYSDVGTARFLVHGSKGQIMIDSLARSAIVSGTGGTETVAAAGDDWLGRELSAFAERCRGIATEDAGHPGWRDGHAAATAVAHAVRLASEPVGVAT